MSTLGPAATKALLALAAYQVQCALEDINSGAVDEADKLNVINYEGRQWELEVRISPVDIYKSPLRPDGKR